MTENKKQKQAARARMAETGENYTTALRHVRREFEAFKKLTGEDMYAGERKYGDRFNFKAWAETGENYTTALRHVRREFEQTPVVSTTPWDYISMVPRSVVDDRGWAKVVERAHEMAVRVAWHNGISAKRLGQAVRCEQASWVVGDDGEYAPHPADGTNTWYSVRLCYEVRPEDGVDTSVTSVRQ